MVKLRRKTPAPIVTMFRDDATNFLKLRETNIATLFLSRATGMYFIVDSDDHTLIKHYGSDRQKSFVVEKFVELYA